MDHSISAEKCTLCGLCRISCPMDLLEPGDAQMLFVQETSNFCIRCGHCIAACPEDAIAIEGLTADMFPLLTEKVASWDALQALLLSRRSVRTFKDEPVEKAMVEKIVEAVMTAPSGSGAFSASMTVLNGRDHIEPMIKPMMAFYRKFHQGMKGGFSRLIMRFMLGKNMFAAMDNFRPIMDRMFAYYDTTGEDPLTWGAPLLMVFHAPRIAISGSHDAIIACTYAMLAAHALGLGTTMIGMVPPYIERTPEEQRRIRIPEDNVVHLSLIAGYPKHGYRRGIRRRSPVDWIK